MTVGLILLAGLVSFLIEVAIAAGLVGGITWLIGAEVTVSAAIGFGLAIIIGRNLLASAFK